MFIIQIPKEPILIIQSSKGTSSLNPQIPHSLPREIFTSLNLFLPLFNWGMSMTAKRISPGSYLCAFRLLFEKYNSQ